MLFAIYLQYVWSIANCYIDCIVVEYHEVEDIGHIATAVVLTSYLYIACASVGNAIYIPCISLALADYHIGGDVLCWSDGEVECDNTIAASRSSEGLCVVTRGGVNHTIPSVIATRLYAKFGLHRLVDSQVEDLNALAVEVDIAQIENIVLNTNLVLELFVGEGAWVYTRLYIAGYAVHMEISWIVVQCKGHILDGVVVVLKGQVELGLVSDYA